MMVRFKAEDDFSGLGMSDHRETCEAQGHTLAAWK